MHLDAVLTSLARAVVDRIPYQDPVCMTPDLRAAVGTHLRGLRAAGRLPTPAFLSGHRTRLEAALDALDGGAADHTRQAYALDELVEWIVRQLYLEGDSIVHKARRLQEGKGTDTGDQHQEDLIARVAGRMAERLDSGTIEDQLCGTSDLVLSAWNGKRHTLAFEGWAARVMDNATAVHMRLRSTSFPMQPAPVPGTLAFEMDLRDGTLFIGSDVPGKDLADLCIQARQQADGQGLAGDLAVTDRLLRERHILAFGVHSGRLVFVSTPTGFLVATAAFGGEKGLPGQQRLNLDYRHFSLIDAHALRENLRTSWDEKDSEVSPRLEQALKGFSGTKVSTHPGRYRFVVPANHGMVIAHHGQDAAVILEARRIETP